MKTFKDNEDRSWTVAINVAAIKRVRSLLDVNLMEAIGGELLELLATDPILLCDVIYVVCKLEADAAGITDEQFGSAMAGDAIEQATEALLEELVSFFPKAKRAVLRKALQKFQGAEAKAIELATDKLDDPKLDRQIDAALNNALNGTTGSASNLPDSSASSPGASPSES